LRSQPVVELRADGERLPYIAIGREVLGQREAAEADALADLGGQAVLQRSSSTQSAAWSDAAFFGSSRSS
jgi:hypothetical protein